MTAYDESIIVTKTIVNFNNTDKTAFTNIELCLYKPIGVVCMVEAPSAAAVDGSGG